MEGLKMIALGSDFNFMTCSAWTSLGASYPLVDDRASEIWREFGNGGVPRNVIIDSEGVVRYNSAGFNSTAIGALLDELLSTSSMDENPTQPSDHQLIRNYPNPFNAGTRIEFNVPVTGFTTLSIHNLSGVKLRTLLEENVSAGSHSFEWNTLNDHGEALPSGVYLVRLNSKGSQGSKKILLLK